MGAGRCAAVERAAAEQTLPSPRAQLEVGTGCLVGELRGGPCADITDRHTVKVKLLMVSAPRELESNVKLPGINCHSVEEGILENHRSSEGYLWLNQFAWAGKFMESHGPAGYSARILERLSVHHQRNLVLAAETQIRECTLPRNLNAIGHDKGGRTLGHDDRTCSEKNHPDLPMDLLRIEPARHGRNFGWRLTAHDEKGVERSNLERHRADLRFHQELRF